MAIIYLGLGSNLGDRAGFLDAAQNALVAQGCLLLAQSSNIETPALLPDNAPEEWNISYLNRVIEMQCNVPPKPLLSRVKQIEQQLGRIDRGRWGPREIDIDILAYDDVVLDDDALQIPHPHIAVRRFVLVPWAEIAPDWQHPVHQQNIAQLCEALND